MILVTGAAGFIGNAVCRQLVQLGYKIVGLDNLNEYYDINLKHARLNLLKNNDLFQFIKLDITNKQALEELFAQYQFKTVINLAAQAGVRFSVTQPMEYIQSNLVGFANILECCRHHNVKHLIFASSSSVYGANKSLPFAESQSTDHPISLYAATKKSNEIMAHSYASLYGLPCTGLRFFTVYGPWGRPDMALFKFTQAMLAGDPIEVFNHGKMKRDFTYIDDITDGIIKLIDKAPVENKDWDGENPESGSSYAPYEIYNIGNNNPTQLMDYIGYLEIALGKEAIKEFKPLQLGDMVNTFSNTDKLNNTTGFTAKTNPDVGVKNFVKWYLEYYKTSIKQNKSELLDVKI